jgi:hypothetical protein
VATVVVEIWSTGVASSDVDVAVEGGAVVGGCDVLTSVASSGVAVALVGGAVVRSVEALTAAGSSEPVAEQAAIAIAAITTLTNLHKGSRASATQFTATPMSAELGFPWHEPV